MKFDGLHRQTTGHLFYTTSSFVHHLKSIDEFKLIQSGNAQLGLKSAIVLVLRDLEIWQMTLKKNRVPVLYYTKLCASIQSHVWIKTGVTVRKSSIRNKIGDFFVLCDPDI